MAMQRLWQFRTMVSVDWPLITFFVIFENYRKRRHVVEEAEAVLEVTSGIVMYDMDERN